MENFIYAYFSILAILGVAALMVSTAIGFNRVDLPVVIAITVFWPLALIKAGFKGLRKL